MLEQIFLKVLDMSRTAGMIIVVVCIARIFLRRFPKCISYMLWSVVLFRLLCPATLELGISLVPSLEPVLYEYAAEKGEDPAEQTGKVALADTGSEAKESQGKAEEQERQEKPEKPEKPGSGQTVPREPLPEREARAAEPSWQEMFLLYGKYVWISGAGIMLLYFLVSTARIRSRVAASIPLKENIYIVDGRMSPFVMGIIRPKIYLPEGLSGKEQEYIVLHERLHIRRLDHIVRPVAFAALCVHWFNPLVWAAFVLSGRDMEMSCDEAVVKRLGEGIRADYSASLLALSAQRPAIRGIPVDFGEGDTKGRIRNLASFRKTGKGALAVLAAGAVILIVCLATTHKTLVPDTGDSEAGTEVAANRGMQDGPEADGTEPAGTGADAPESEGPDGLESDAPEPDRPEPGKPDEPEAPEPLNVSLDIREHYATHKAGPHNLFYIDGDNVLWGNGGNEY
uniref:M56 family metallopeptidase n=1 Tax=uncultured Acetatifactor sp. TaxID=1671927 RepID=UPI00272AA850